MRTTLRGFDIHEFKDSNGEGCSVQKSSSAERDCIWLGVDNPKIMQGGWHPEFKGQLRDLPKHERDRLNIEFVGGRMHLARENVQELLPLLQKFAETGELT